MFARKKRTIVPISHSFAMPVLSQVVPITLRSFDTLCHEVFKGSHTCETIHACVDDIHLLLMQRDFEKRYPLEYRNFIESMSVASKSTLVKTKLPKMSDNQLMSYIKSRHIQQPSELRAWFNYLSSQYDIELDAFNKAQNDGQDDVNSPEPAPSNPSSPAPADSVSK